MEDPGQGREGSGEEDAVGMRSMLEEVLHICDHCDHRSHRIFEVHNLGMQHGLLKALRILMGSETIGEARRQITELHDSLAKDDSRRIVRAGEEIARGIGHE